MNSLDKDISSGHSLDIVKVYRPKKEQHCCFNNYDIGELVYDALNGGR